MSGRRILTGACAIALLTARPAFPVNGIAVSTRMSNSSANYNGGDIVRYDINNGDVVKETVLLDCKGGNQANAHSKGLSPTISKNGTMVAFYRFTPDSGWIVSVINIDGTRLRSLARIPNQSGYDGHGYMYWTAAGWIYYIQGGWQSAQAGNRHLWRVKESDPSTNQEVVTFAQPLWQWGISADGSRMIVRPSSDYNDGTGFHSAYLYLPPGNGQFSSTMHSMDGGGCGLAISPSGTEVTKLEGGSHSGIAIASWDHAIAGANPDRQFHAVLINNRILPGGRVPTRCGYYEFDTTITIYAGIGMDCNRWSSNSDKWMCLQMGWVCDPSGSGRYPVCGSNQVLFNWVDTVAINATRYKRVCTDNFGFGPNCDIDLPDSMYRRSDAGDFFVTAPSTDINADLRSLVAVGPSDAPRDMAKGNRRFSVERAGKIIRITIAGRGTFSVRISDIKGGIVAAGTIAGQGDFPLPTRIGLHNVNYITVTGGGCSRTETIIGIQ